MLPLRARVDLGAMAMKRVLRIPQSSSTAGTSPSDCLVSYPGNSLGGGVPPLQRCSQCILQPQLTGQTQIEYSFIESNLKYQLQEYLLTLDQQKEKVCVVCVFSCVILNRVDTNLTVLGDRQFHAYAIIRPTTVFTLFILISTYALPPILSIYICCAHTP